MDKKLQDTFVSGNGIFINYYVEHKQRNIELDFDRARLLIAGFRHNLSHLQIGDLSLDAHGRLQPGRE